MARQIRIEDRRADALEAVRGTSLDQPPRPPRDTTDLTLAELSGRDLSPEAIVARLAAD